MKLANKQLSRSVQSWINRVEGRHPPNVRTRLMLSRLIARP